MGFSNPTGIEFVSDARRELADQNAETSPPPWGESVIQLGSLTAQSAWTANSVRPSSYRRRLDITLSHETHTLEVKINSVSSAFKDVSAIGSILLDKKAIVKGSEITYKVHTFSISDGQKQREANVWLRADRKYHIVEFQLKVDGKILYQE